MRQAPLLAHVRRSLHRDLCIARPVPDAAGVVRLPVHEVPVEVRLLPGGEVPLVQVSAVAAAGLPVKAAVLREVNDVNLALVGARVVLEVDVLSVRGELEVVSVERGELGRLVMRVAETASRVGSMLVAVHGGHRPSPARGPAQDRDA